MYKFDVVALGELLIDFTNNGISNQGNTLFEANPGGAPCNVLAMLNKCGKKTSLIGKVGEDIFGVELKLVLDNLGIDTSNLVTDKKVPTTLAFIHTIKDGDREFSFYRNPGADVMLKEEEVNEKLIKAARIFHFGSLSLTHDEIRKATKKALKIAKNNKITVSFDPNLREPLWESLEEAREQIAFGLTQCDILKIADNELQWFTRESDFDKGIARLKAEYNIPLILLTMGRRGSRAYYKDFYVEAPPFLQENTIEATGAGDTFFGCCLNYILENDLNNMNEEALLEMLTFGNAAASIITTRRGALCVMPGCSEVESLIKKENR
ncbi:fructokinase [Anaerocolumna jejuensis DSM 15929]|uniref:Fructokinase n=1 Tax=Anaerocolumna jejuensis DSM 15929 TaxID=1121322 RepID=A0A1M7BP76_9FIRM|nr:carbohydrate kinase [Anaerocolumna jejuensis]SHL56656.1 fructokinase [Anaerocolumna jejuensis DSM 15929]